MNDLQRIKCMIYRSGTSKGLYFLQKDLPQDKAQRDALVLKAVGSPDIRQIDGMGGATDVTTKVAVVCASNKEGIDLEYKFLQPSIDEASVNDKPTCGNMLTAVGAFGLEQGLVPIQEGQTTVMVHDVNTGAIISQTIQTPNKIIHYRGDFEIPGVPGGASPIKLFFKNISGSKSGHYMPTGNPVDIIDGIEVSCLDVSMPVVFVYAKDMNITGYETFDELKNNKALFERMEKIREEASIKMGLGSAKGNVIPKFGMIAPAQETGDFCIRYFTPTQVHPALAVSSGFCAAMGCFLKGTILNAQTQKTFELGEHLIQVETLLGIMDVGINFPSDDFSEVEGKTTRTVRLLVDGEVLV